MPNTTINRKFFGQLVDLGLQNGDELGVVRISVTGHGSAFMEKYTFRGFCDGVAFAFFVERADGQTLTVTPARWMPGLDCFVKGWNAAAQVVTDANRAHVFTTEQAGVHADKRRLAHA